MPLWRVVEQNRRSRDNQRQRPFEGHRLGTARPANNDYVENAVSMLILASQSLVRQTLLANAGLRFRSCPAQIDERRLETDSLGTGAGPAAVARALAEAKAQAIAAQHPEALVIGCDQVLDLDGELLHKPASPVEAGTQLLRLRGRTHKLHAGIALAQHSNLVWSMVESAALTMRAFAREEMEAVLAAEGKAALNSVGGYRLEGPSIRLFERFEGDYFTILGLPLLPLLAALRQYGPHELDGFT
jgi:septum formation protein